jgi:hypothetical protein
VAATSLLAAIFALSLPAVPSHAVPTEFIHDLQGNGAATPPVTNGAPAANGNGAPATNGSGPSNGNGAKRAGPLQIRDLAVALRGKLDVKDPDRQVAWINGMLPEGRQIKSLVELTPEETVTLTAQAQNGEVPGGAGR